MSVSYALLHICGKPPRARLTYENAGPPSCKAPPDLGAVGEKQVAGRGLGGFGRGVMSRTGGWLHLSRLDVPVVCSRERGIKVSDSEGLHCPLIRLLQV